MNTIGKHSTLLRSDDWHPLDGVPAPEYIPPFWIGPHVGLRLVEAFKTLSRMPMPGRISTKSGMWPQYRHDWEDWLAQVTADKDAREQDAREQNRARLQPTAEDISRMEKVIVWPGRYLGTRPMTAHIVQRVAAYRARGVDNEVLARKLKHSPAFIRRCNRCGLDAIASGLRRDQEAVF
jgi:hypothetical protein